jgi:hypothetical protein
MKNSIVAYIVIGLILLAVAGVAVFTPVFRNTAVTSTVNGAGGISCPEGYACTAKPILSCTTSNGNTPKVVLRCGANQDWFSIDTDEDGDLDFYTKCTSFCSVGGTTTTVATCPNEVQVQKRVSDGKYGMIINGRWTEYKLGQNTLYTQLAPLEGFESKEVISGNTAQYVCSQDVFINNLKVDTISYSGATPITSYTPKTYDVAEGKVFKWNGDVMFSQSKMVINYCKTTQWGNIPTGTARCDGNTLYKCSTPTLGGDAVLTTDPCTGRKCVESSPTVASCQYDQICASNIGNLQAGQKKCNYNILYECTSTGLSTAPKLTTTDCAALDKVCTADLKCDVPYTTSVKINGESPTSIVQILSGKTIDVSFTVTESVVQRRNVIVTLYKGTTPLVSLSDDSAKATKVISLPSQPAGYYDLKIVMQHPDMNFDKTYTIQIVQGVSATVSSPNPIQFDNEPIQLKLETFQGGVRVPVTDYEWDATFRNSAVQTATTRNPSLGIYEAYFNLKDEGVLRARARVQYEQNGAWSDYSDYYEVTVKKTTVTIIPEFRTDIVLGTYTFKFQTKDSTGKLVSTSNIISLESSSGTQPLSVRETTPGSYEFDVNFPSGGLYYIKVTSTATNIGSTQLNNGNGQPINVFKSDNEGGNETNWLMYGLFGVIIAGIGLIVYAIVRRKKK